MMRFTLYISIVRSSLNSSVMTSFLAIRFMIRPLNMLLQEALEESISQLVVDDDDYGGDDNDEEDSVTTTLHSTTAGRPIPGVSISFILPPLIQGRQGVLENIDGP